MRELDETGALLPDEPVHVLEVGSGQGSFALNFIEALEHGCGARGRALAGRLRYVLSDYSPRNLEESTANPGLARLVAAGTVVPALFDLRRPTELTIPGPRSRPSRGRSTPGRPGARPAEAANLVAVFTNYVCCVSPQKVVRRTKGELLEKCVRLSIDVEDAAEAKQVGKTLAGAGRGAALPPLELLKRVEATYTWRPLDLEAAFEDPYHRELLADFVAPLGAATVNYPHAFLDLVRGLLPRMLPGGLFLISDFGNPDRSDVQGPTSDRPPVKYGLSLTHDVDFAVFDVFAAREGLGLVRTDDGLFEVHTVALRNMPRVPASFAARFEKTHALRASGQELLDLSAAAATLFDARRFHESARLYAQCLRIAPRSPQVIYRLGRACLSANVQGRKTLSRLARRVRLGRRLDAAGKHDWDTLLAGVYLQLGEAERARRLLKQSLAREETAPKHAALALVLETLGERRRAYASHLRALELAPEGEPSRLTRERLVQDYLLGDDAPVRWSRRATPTRKRRGR